MECAAERRKTDILFAAETLFARQGYDGTRVDQIAAGARVNKATIYYYFKNKQAILDSLIEDFMQDVCDKLITFLEEATAQFLPNGIKVHNGTFILADPDGGQDWMGFIEQYILYITDYFEHKQNMLRIMLTESLKDGENRFLLFRFTDLLQYGGNAMLDALHVSGMEFTVDQALLVTKFFGGVLPIVFYAVSCEAWTVHYHTSKARLKTELTALFRMLLLGYMQVQTHAQKSAE